MQVSRGVALLCLLVGACAKNEYQMRKEFQTQQAERLRPAELEHDSGGWHAVRTLRVRLYVDADALHKDSTQREFEERLERANQVLQSALRLRLKLDDMRELPAQRPEVSTDEALVALQQLDPAKDVDLVVAIIAASPVVTLSFHDLGRAQLIGRHLVLRTMDDVAELRALEGFDTLDPAERSRLYQQRKRHKETTVLLHELGHTLGALHTRDPLELMYPTYDNDMQAFAPANVELMKNVADYFATEPGARDDKAVVQKLIDCLERAESPVWVEQERQEQLAALERALATGAQPAPTAGPSLAVANAAPSKPAPPTEDLSALSEADRARYLGLDQAFGDNRLQEARTTAGELARAYPDSLPVQQKACQLGMQMGLARREIKPYCDRMMQLSLQPTGH
jgi:hypothetical protein